MFTNDGCISSFLSGITNLFKGHLEDTGKTLLQENLDTRYRDPKIKNSVQEIIRVKYGEEPFYNDLDSYIEGNRVVENLISALQGGSKIQSNYKLQFTVDNTTKFCDSYKRYKRKKVECAKISSIFSEIFDEVYSCILTINPHTDLGKVQCDIHVMSTETQYSHQEEMMAIKSIDSRIANMERMMMGGKLSGLSEEPIEDILGHSKTVDNFYERIKQIESDFQHKHLFHEALAHYQKLLMNMIPSMQQSSKADIEKLICVLYCNMALCYSHLGNYQEAQSSIDQIPEEIVKNNKRYYFISAVIIVQNNQEDKYPNALAMLGRALDIDPNYKKSFWLQNYLQAFLGTRPIPQILADFDNPSNKVDLKEDNEDDIAEYYQYRGLINLVANNYDEALVDIRRALDYGYDEFIGKLNISVILYGQATQSIPREGRLLSPKVNQKLMLEDISLLEELLTSAGQLETFPSIKNQIISLYVSACASIGIPHKLTPLSNYLYDDLDYEVQRSLLLGSNEKLSEEQINLLHADDKLYYQCALMLDENQEASCFEKLVELADHQDPVINNSTFYLLLQLCLTMKNVDYYWKYRSLAPQYGINSPLLSFLDAVAYETGGKLDESKNIFDSLAESAVDDNILENTLRFYKRNKHTQALTKLYLRIHRLIVERRLYYHNIEDFYLSMERFFLAQKNPILSNVLAELPESLLPEKFRLEMHAQYYIEINDLGKLYRCFEMLECQKGSFNNAFNMALTAKRIFKYGDALQICNSIKNKTSNLDEKVKVLWLISDVLLLQGKKDESFHAAQEVHQLTIQNPYEPSHQYFMARGMRCGHQEVLKDAIEYKHTHPVVIDWLHEIHLPDGPDMGEKLIQKLGEVTKNRENPVDLENKIADLYRHHQLPIYSVLEFYHWDWSQFFSALRHCKIHISTGNINELKIEEDSIHGEVVTDMLTLSIMAAHNCLGLLNQMEKVHINYNSIVEIQAGVLSYGYPFQEQLIAWVQTSPNVVYENDGLYKEDTDALHVIGKDFSSCCHISKCMHIPYLYCDSIIGILNRSSELPEADGVQFVSISAACYKLSQDNSDQLSDCLYSLMKNCQFVSFTASTILHQIEKVDYHITDELLQPFLFCKSNCDMESFSMVYLATIRVLCIDHREAALEVSRIILKDTLRIIKQTTYDKHLYKTLGTGESSVKIARAEKYANTIIKWIPKFFENVPDDITSQCKLILSYMQDKTY